MDNPMHAASPLLTASHSLRNLQSRFVPDATEQEAAQHMVERVRESFAPFRTALYDQFQKVVEDIEY
jgi:hypothetical protein